MTEPTAPPTWWEDPDLAAAVAEVEDFVATAGWDRAPQMFALVRTSDLVAAGGLPESPDHAVFTAIAQEPLPHDNNGDMAAALSTISWPAEVAGCVLVQEIIVLPPDPEGAELTAEQAAVQPDRQEARLVAGVLRDVNGGACLLRVRPADSQDSPPPLRGADLAPNLLTALHATFA